MAGLEDLRLGDYRPTKLDVSCRRCARHASVGVYGLHGRFGNATLGEIARGIAAAGDPPCNLASAIGNTLCDALPIEPPVDQWATIYHALHGGWLAYLQCHRRRDGLKSTKSCPGPIQLDVRSLAAALGTDFKLENLACRLECPMCGTKALAVEWIVPPPAPPPEPIAAHASRLRAAGETLHQPARPGRGGALRVIKGETPWAARHRN